MRRAGLLRGACNRARIRATRWLAMMDIKQLMKFAAIEDDLRRHGLLIQRAVAGGRQVPTEGSRHGAAAHAVEAVLRHEGLEGAANAAEKGFGRRLLEQ